MKTREQMKQEALQCMEAIGLSKGCIKAFRDRDMIWTSERGCLYEDEEFHKLAKQVEEEYGGLVYHIDHTIFEFGDCLSMFYISKYEEDGDLEETINDLKDGYAFCYVYNQTDPMFSEFGSISFRPVIGGVMRMG